MNKKVHDVRSKNDHQAETTLSRILLLWAFVVFWACFIFFMSAHTGNDLDHGSGIIGWIKQHLTLAAEVVFGPGTDAVSVIAHFLEYTVFGVLLTGALAFTSRYRWVQGGAVNLDPSKILRIAVIGAIVIASLYGVSDEIHQIFVPGRVCDALDWLTDTLGASLGSLICAFALSRRWRNN